MKTMLRISLAMALLIAVNGSIFAQSKPMRLIPLNPYDPFVDEAGNPISDPDAPAYAPLCMALYGLPNLPILAPDGHHVTVGELMEVTGHATAKCTRAGTHINLHLKNLLPGGVYTVWIATFGTPGFDWFWTDVIAAGALGSPDGSENTLHVSASGEAQLNVFQPAGPGPLSWFGELSEECVLDEVEFELVIAYHLDHQSYGPIPTTNECLMSAPIGFRSP